MFRYYNPNPKGRRVGDCSIRAICKATGKTWDEVYAGVSSIGFDVKDMPSANYVWGAYLRENGFVRRLVDDHGLDLYTVSDFCAEHKEPCILSPSGHVIAVSDGDYFDTWDSGNEVPIYYWTRES